MTNAVIKLLRPLIRILMRYGLSCPEFVEISRQIYVDVADTDFTISGKKQTVSRIATLTGLSRKDVQKIKSEINTGNEIVAAENRATRVIMGWLKDAEFLNRSNKPVVLQISGPQVSFETLVKRYSGDIPPKAILDELIRIGAVELKEGDKLQLITEGYIPKTEQEKIEVMAKCVRDQLETIDFNLNHPPYEARFQRQIRYVDLSPEIIKEFKEFSKEKCIELITSFNLWLSEKKKNQALEKQAEEKGQVGFGLYYFEKEKPDED